MASQDGGSEAISALHQSLDKARELYFRLLWLPVELTDMQERRLDDRRHKLLVTQEDLNPNLKFVDNSLVKAIQGVRGYKKLYREGKDFMGARRSRDDG